jgi:beta-carotene hydroxylase
MAMSASNAMQSDRRLSSRVALALPENLGAELERLSLPNSAAFASLTALYLAVWAAGVALVVTPGLPIAWQLLLSALLGSQLHALTVLQHDCGHRSAFRSASANLWVGRLLAWFVFMPFTTFTELHRRHHGFLGDRAQDPDEWFYEGGTRQLFLRECLFMPRFVVLSLKRVPAGVARQRIVGELAFNAITHAALIAALIYFNQWNALIYAYALPMAWLALVFNPISRGYEHYPMAGLTAGDARRSDLRSNTISVTSRSMGALWANIGFHVEHHMYPRVPFYRLPALHRLFVGKSYLRAPYPLHDLAGHEAACAIHVKHSNPVSHHAPRSAP